MTGRRVDGFAAAVASRASRRSLLRRLLGGVLWTNRPRTTTAQCDQVEISPGYPGYRGYVTGLDWVGDHACLDDLLAVDSDFDPAFENRQNRRAARRLGLAGSKAVLTWENLMAIEAERGMLPTCYSCAINSAANRASPGAVPTRPNDPRLLIGGYGTTYALTGLAMEYDLPAWYLTQAFAYDHRLRAIVCMGAGRHLNASEILAAFHYTAARASTTGIGQLNIELAGRNLIAQGGYAPTPSTAAPDDKISMIAVGLEALCTGLHPWACNAMLANFDSVVTEWTAERTTGSTLSFAEWLRERGWYF